jgi:hypothetical protein
MFTNTGSSVHDLVIVATFMGALFSGYAGMTIWARKGGKPAGGSSSAACWALGVFILAAATQCQAEIDSTARSAGLTPCPHCAERIKGRARACRYCQRDVGPGRRSQCAGPKVRHQSAQATTGTQVPRAIAARAGPAARRG